MRQALVAARLEQQLQSLAACWQAPALAEQLLNNPADGRADDGVAALAVSHHNLADLQLQSGGFRHFQTLIHSKINRQLLRLSAACLAVCLRRALAAYRCHRRVDARFCDHDAARYGARLELARSNSLPGSKKSPPRRASDTVLRFRAAASSACWPVPPWWEPPWSARAPSRLAARQLPWPARPSRRRRGISSSAARSAAPRC
jgi:hypothetical protein